MENWVRRTVVQALPFEQNCPTGNSFKNEDKSVSSANGAESHYPVIPQEQESDPSGEDSAGQLCLGYTNCK